MNAAALRRPSGGCYTFASWLGGLPTVPDVQVDRVLNSMAAGRRLATRAVLWQFAATAGLAMLLLWHGPSAAFAALLGGGVLVLGNALLARVGLRRDAPAAGAALGRLVAGVVMKWVLVALLLALGIGVMQLPALAVLAGLLVSEVAFAIAGATARIEGFP